MSGRDKISSNRAAAGGQTAKFYAIRSEERFLVRRSGPFCYHQARFEESSGELCFTALGRGK